MTTDYDALAAEFEAEAGAPYSKAQVDAALAAVVAGEAPATPKASPTVTGTVKTNSSNADPTVYLKSEVDTAIANVTIAKATTSVSGTVKINSSNADPVVYLKSEVDTLVAGVTAPKATSTVSGTVKTNTDDGGADPKVYLKAEVDTALALKLDASAAPTYATTSARGLVKVNTNDGSNDPVVYRKSEVDTLIAAIPSAPTQYLKYLTSDFSSSGNNTYADVTGITFNAINNNEKWLIEWMGMIEPRTSTGGQLHLVVPGTSADYYGSANQATTAHYNRDGTYIQKTADAYSAADPQYVSCGDNAGWTQGSIIAVVGTNGAGSAIKFQFKSIDANVARLMKGFWMRATLLS